eukprot:COSAG02_NODE_1895_length_10468_cov_4.296268_8_plen_164_part_00
MGGGCGSTLFGIRPHSWEVLPMRKNDGVVRGTLDATGGLLGLGKPVSASASKNAKRRQKKPTTACKGDSGHGAAEVLCQQGASGSSGLGIAASMGATFPLGGAVAGTTQQDPAKKARSLQKKLRQIAQLKEKKASGVVLEVNQLSKIDTEASIRAELDALPSA